MSTRDSRTATRGRPLVIFGERASGTNYVEKLLLANIKGVSARRDLGWKHGFSDVDVLAEHGCIVLVVVRNPFDWIRSVHRHPWHAAPDLKSADFSSFIRSPWRSVWDQDALNHRSEILGPRIDGVAVKEGEDLLLERDRLTGEPFANVVKLRNAKHRHWLALKDAYPDCLVVRFEDAATAPKAFVQDVARRFGLERRWWFRNVRSYKGLGWRKYRPAPYSPLASTDREFILSQLERDIERVLGYDPDAAGERAAR